MNRCALLAILLAGVAQVACSKDPITLRHPINQKAVQCPDEGCASQYEAAGYVRVNKPEPE